MADRSVVVRLVAMVGQYQAAIGRSVATTRALETAALSANRTAAASASTLARSQKGALTQTATTLRSMRSMMLGFGVPIGLAVLVKGFLDFEQKMAHVKAVADQFGRSATGFQALSDAALNAGQRFGFTAVEVAKAEEALVKAGRSTSQVLGGDLTASLTLAAAGTISLDEAAKITATTMTVFAKEGLTAVQVADTLTGAANVTVSGVLEMGSALSYVGPLAASLGVSFQDTVATLSVFNQAGIDAERAGTNLRGMLTNLLSPSAMARKEMIRLGIDLFDAQGKFVGMAETAQILADKIGTLGEREKAEAVGRLTTNASMPGFITLMLGGAASVETMKKAIEDSATAQEVAAAKLNSVTGELQKFGSAALSAAIKVGAHLSPALSEMAKGLTSAATGFGNLSGMGQLAILALGAQLLMARRVTTAYRGMSGSISSATDIHRKLLIAERAPDVAAARPMGFIGPMPSAARQEADRLRALTREYSKLTGEVGRTRAEYQTATTAAGKFGAVAGGAARGAGAAFSGLTGFLGGPFGVALAAALIGFTIWQSKVAESKRITESFRSGLAQLGVEYVNTGVVSDANIRQMFRQNAEMQWLISNTDQLGVSLSTVAQAAAGQGDAFDKITHQLKIYERDVKAVRQAIEVESARVSTGGRVSEANKRELARLDIKPKTASWYNTESAATLDRLEVVEEKLKAVREEFERTHKAEALLFTAMADKKAAEVADQMKRLGITFDDASVASDMLTTNLATLNSTEAEFATRIGAMTENVNALTTAFYAVASAQSAFYSASQEGLKDAFSEEVPGTPAGTKKKTGNMVQAEDGSWVDSSFYGASGSGAGGSKYGTTTTSEESSRRHVVAGKAATSSVRVVKGGPRPKKPVPDKVTTTQNADGTTTTVTTKTAADGTKTITTTRTGIPASSEQEKTRQQVTTTRRPDGSTITTTTTTAADGSKTTETRKTYDPADVRKPAVKPPKPPKPATPASTRKVGPKIDEVTGQLDVTTERGRKQHAALAGMAEATSKTVIETFNQTALAGKNTGEAMANAGLVATASFIKQREEAVKSLQAVGLTEKQARALADAYYAIPAEVATAVNAHGGEETLELFKKLGVEIVSLPRGQVGIVTNTKAEADKLRALGGIVKKLPSGKFKVTFTNQAAATKAIDAYADKVKDAVPPVIKTKAKVEITEAMRSLIAVNKEREKLAGVVDIYLRTHDKPAAGQLNVFRQQLDAIDRKVITAWLKVPGLADALTKSNLLVRNVEYIERTMFKTGPGSTKDSKGTSPRFGEWKIVPPRKDPVWVERPRRWGGLREAEHGLLSGAKVATGGPLYQWAEPATGGEAFIPRRGDTGRSTAILGQAASWYGMGVHKMAVGGTNWSGQKLTSAAPNQVVITVRGEGALAGMIEATVDGRLVTVERTIAHGRVR